VDVHQGTKRISTSFFFKIRNVQVNIPVLLQENKRTHRTLIVMKYTVRHVKRFLEQGTIDSKLWMEHFPTLLDTRVPGCRDCEDYKKKLCEGGKNPVECFLSIQPEPDRVPETPAGDDLQRKKPKPPKWSPKAHDIRKPLVANKTYDQSKM
jgi:hypothetical protein